MDRDLSHRANPVAWIIFRELHSGSSKFAVLHWAKNWRSWPCILHAKYESLISYLFDHSMWVSSTGPATLCKCLLNAWKVSEKLKILGGKIVKFWLIWNGMTLLPDCRSDANNVLQKQKNSADLVRKPTAPQFAHLWFTCLVASKCSSANLAINFIKLTIVQFGKQLLQVFVRK